MPLSREISNLGLFMRPLDAAPMKFSLGRGRPCHEEVERMIEEGGGILETPKKPDVDRDRIKLRDNEVVIFEKDSIDVFSVQYIYDCFDRNELLRNLADYRLNKKSYFLPYDPFEILIGVKKWSDLQRDEGEECSDIEEDDSILVTNPAENLKVGKLPYSKRDQVEILKYIIEHGAFKQLKGKTLWQDMERNKKVCKGQRTWQSMKEHFRRQILPSLNKFDFILNEDLKIQILTGGEGGGGEQDVCRRRREDVEEGILHLRRRFVKKDDGISSKSVDKSRVLSSPFSRKPSSDDETTNDGPVSSQKPSEKRDAENILEKDDDRSILLRSVKEKISIEKSAPFSSSRKSSSDDAIVNKSPVSSQKFSEKKKGAENIPISPRISVEKSADKGGLSSRKSSNDDAIANKGPVSSETAENIPISPQMSVEKSAEESPPPLRLSRMSSNDDAISDKSPVSPESAENIPISPQMSVEKFAEESPPPLRLSRMSSNDDAISDKSPVFFQKSSDGARISPEISVGKKKKEVTTRRDSSSDKPDKKSRLSPQKKKKSDAKDIAISPEIFYKKMKKKSDSDEKKKKSEEADRRPRRKRNSSAPPPPSASSNDENRRKNSDNDEPGDDILTAFSLKRTSSRKKTKKLWNWNNPEGAIPDIHSPFVEKTFDSVNTLDFVGGLSSATRSSSPIADEEVRTTRKKSKKAVSSSDSENNGKKTSTKKKNHGLNITKMESSKSRVPYTEEEDTELIRFIRDNKLYGKRKGVYIWKLMEEREVLPERTWQSMKNRFLNITKDFTKFGVSLEAMEESVIVESSDEEEKNDFLPDRKKPYKRKEDQKILDFIVENGRFSEVGGNSLWELMEVRGILPGRTAQSMKERFRRRILPRIPYF